MLELFHPNAAGPLVAAVDEAGRGCGAFPVVAAACVWDTRIATPDGFVERINDSKKLSARSREELASYIRARAVDHAVASASVEDIDKHNILRATMRAMHAALDKLQREHFSHVLVDGSVFEAYRDVPHTCVVAGDSRYIGIAAASILAKTARDDMVRAAVEREPVLRLYDMHRNMGYLTPRHLTALRAHGATRHHRRSFRPVAQAGTQGTAQQQERGVETRPCPTLAGVPTCSPPCTPPEPRTSRPTPGHGHACR